MFKEEVENREVLARAGQHFIIDRLVREQPASFYMGSSHSHYSYTYNAETFVATYGSGTGVSR